MQCSAFLGVVTIQDNPFLVLADETKLACTLDKHKIYYIHSASVIPFGAEPTERIDSNFISPLKKILTNGFYFSYTKDLTISMMAEGRGTSYLYTSSFQWTKNLMEPLTTQNIDKNWAVSLIQGSVGFFEMKLQGNKLQYFLISRRSRFMAGTRYNARGCDDDGNVANFIETEQIIHYQGVYTSHVQLRGSVPLFWTQKGVTASLEFTRPINSSNPSFISHFGTLNQAYGDILVTSLLNRSTSDEKTLQEAYDMLLETNKTEIPYVLQCKCDGIIGQKSQYSFCLVKEMLKGFNQVTKYTILSHSQTTSGELTAQQIQDGILRANCVDCLETTNEFQMNMAMLMVEDILKGNKIILNEIVKGEPLMLLATSKKDGQHPFVVNFDRIWHKNGDMISLHYAGTGTTANKSSSFMKVFDKGVQALNRFYMGNFEDASRQQCIELLTGNDSMLSTSSLNEMIEAELLSYESDFCSYNDVSIFISTWNVGACDPKLIPNLENLINLEGQPPADLFIFGFQEAVDLKPQNVIVDNNETIIQNWIARLTTLLNSEPLVPKGSELEYTIIAHESLVGLVLIVFGKTSLKSRIKRVSKDIVKTGIAGTMGNKGSTIIKFTLDDSSLVFLNCHLEAGQSKLADRINNITDIHSKAFQQGSLGRKKEQKIDKIDFRFLFGDFNFRVNLQYQDAVDKITNATNPESLAKCVKELVANDQLLSSKGMSEFLVNYNEKEISFLPTYKYDLGGQVYDTSKKKRVPSYCDRILFWGPLSKKYQQLFYQRREFTCSDHRPVTTYYVIPVKKIDYVKKEEILKQLYANGKLQGEESKQQ